MTTDRAAKNATRIAELIDAGKLTDREVIDRLTQIMFDRKTTSPNPEMTATLHLRDIKKLAQDKRVPLHLGRFLQSIEMTAWMDQLAPAHDAVLAQRAGTDAAAAVKTPIAGGSSAPQPARFTRKAGGMSP
ncbi:MAG: hypothetical protein K0R10_216 [Alphaproteobacteria bacterium]|jgi:hypothetical protein|nr:hypothetical protein [Alphaproteobacteria bacterium]